MRRLLLVVNANAQTVTRPVRRVISRALAAGHEVHEVETERRGDAARMASEAEGAGYDLLVALGGDGTVNEIVNGLMASGGRLPLGVLPGGGANVFARALGAPIDPIEAAEWLLERLERAPRRLAIGRADGRYFTSNCGIGIDAAVVRRVEARQLAKRAAGEAFFAWAGLRELGAFDRRTGHLRLSWGPELEHDRAGLMTVIVQNHGAYTYLGERAMRLCPAAGLDSALACIALDSLRVRTLLRTLAAALGRGRGPRGRHVLRLDDERRLAIECDRPMPVQVDGEYVGERERVEVASVPAALAVYT